MKRLFSICVFVYLATISTAKEKDLGQILRSANNNFTVKLFYEIVKSTPDKSVVVSAFSVMPPLAQLALASVGESHDELLECIGMPNDNVTKEAFSSVDRKLRLTKGVTIKTASKIYVADRYELNTKFERITRDIFGSEFQKINFAKRQEAADNVNAWVEDQTNHRIKNLVSPDNLGKSTRALLVNAIYFKGTWNIPFKKENTIDKQFYVFKDEIVQIPTMYHKGIYRYANNMELQAQILEISYEGDELYESSLVIILPHNIDGIKELEKKLRDPSVFEAAVSYLEETEIEVYIPIFKIETTTDLKEILQKINVTKVFSPEKARLENLIDGLNDLYVDWAVQKAFIEINEEGAEAAAANSFGINEVDSISLTRPVPPVFRADRPFYFAVRTNSLTLFNGVMHGK